MKVEADSAGPETHDIHHHGFRQSEAKAERLHVFIHRRHQGKTLMWARPSKETLEMASCLIPWLIAG